MFAFKPVWGLAFALVPILMRRWRFAAAMAGTGAALAALTLPVVGLHSWLEWLKVGEEAAFYYNRSANWINLSRDVQGIPRRFLHDFSVPIGENTPLEDRWGWAVWGAVFTATVFAYAISGERRPIVPKAGVVVSFVATVLVYLARGVRRKPTGLGAGFLFLGAFLSCYRFMYYDVLLSLAAFAVLFADPWCALRTRVFDLTAGPRPAVLGDDFIPPAVAPDPFGPRQVGYVNSYPLTILVGLFLVVNVVLGWKPEATFGIGSWASVATATDGSTAVATPQLKLAGVITYPWDTALLLLLWVWCGVRLIVCGDERAEVTDSRPGVSAPGP